MEQVEKLILVTLVTSLDILDVDGVNEPVLI